MSNNTYVGDDILIEEMPQGCIITPIGRHPGCEKLEFEILGDYLTISSKDDAVELIESLKRMLESHYGVTRNVK